MPPYSISNTRPPSLPLHCPSSTIPTAFHVRPGEPTKNPLLALPKGADKLKGMENKTSSGPVQVRTRS